MHDVKILLLEYVCTAIYQTNFKKYYPRIDMCKVINRDNKTFITLPDCFDKFGSEFGNPESVAVL